jgi:hypothetical protein
MQYWLLYYNKACPAGWNTYNTGGDIFCYTNSPANTIGTLKAKELGDVSFVAQATSGGNDEVTMTNGSEAASASNSDTELHLAAVWNTTEWGAFGDAGGAEANFGANSTFQAQTSLHATSSTAPTCVSEGFTGETNNLDLTHTPAIGAEPSPTMVSEQTNSTASSASCAVAS